MSLICKPWATWPVTLLGEAIHRMPPIDGMVVIRPDMTILNGRVDGCPDEAKALPLMRVGMPRPLGLLIFMRGVLDEAALKEINDGALRRDNLTFHGS